MTVSIEGVRHWCDSVEETFSPRLNEDIPRGQQQKQIPEAFLAYAFGLIRAMADDLEAGLSVAAPQENGDASSEEGEQTLFVKAYSQFWVTVFDQESEGPFASREDAQAYLDKTEEAELVNLESTILMLSREPEDIRCSCMFTGKPSMLTLTVADEDFPMAEEVARELYGALGKLFG